MNRNIGYHTRLVGNNTVKVCGGSFGGAIDMATVDRLVSAYFTVEVNSTGRAIFVDREGRRVRLYLSIDAEDTTMGKEAIKVWRVADNARREKEAELSANQEGEIDDLLGSMTHEEAVRRLRGDA